MFDWLLALALALATQDLPAQQAPPAAEPAELLAMPAELKARLHAEVLAGEPTKYERLQRIAQFATSPDGLGVVYQGDATTTITETYASRRANCLGFTLLFLALAREAGLRAYPQDAGETLSWQEVDGTVIRSAHVNVGVLIEGQRYTLDVGGEVVFDTHPPIPLTDDALFARYYNNIAVGHLLDGETERARREMAIALALDPRSGQQWSNSGVLAMHNGDVRAARHAYATALSLDPTNPNALLNMVTLARRAGDALAERTWRRRLEQVQRRDPIHQFILGLDAERNGEYPRAITQYRRAIRLHRGEHRFHSALARAYLLTGDARRAASALVQASRYSDGAIRAAYQDELQELRGAE